MSEEEKLELQFERAELDRPAGAPATPAAIAVSRVACGACGNHVRSYFSVNARTVCKRCHDEAVAAHGAHLLPLLKAFGLGLLAAALGAFIYFGVAKLTGYEIGLVSIVVGLLVGGAVKLGSGGRGGWRYQALAVGLCYLSIASSYGAFVAVELFKRGEAEAAQAAKARAGSPAQPASLTTGATAPRADQPAEDEAAPSGGQVLGELLLLVLKLPFLVGLESPMAFVLVAIALWEAWKLNVGQPFVTAGPFAVGQGEPAAG